MHHRTDLSSDSLAWSCLNGGGSKILGPAERGYGETDPLRPFEAKRQLNFEIGFDHAEKRHRVAMFRSPGSTENGQETLPVGVRRSCDEIKAHTGGAMIGIPTAARILSAGCADQPCLVAAMLQSARKGRGKSRSHLRNKAMPRSSERLIELEPFHWNTWSAMNSGDLLHSLPVLLPRLPKWDLCTGTDRSGNGALMGCARGEREKSRTTSPDAARFGRYAPAIFARKIIGEAQTGPSIFRLVENGCLRSRWLTEKHAKVCA